VTIVAVFMMLSACEAGVVKGVKEATSKQDTLKDEPQLKENSMKEADVAPEKEAKEQGGEASAGEDEKKIEETSNSKDGGDDDGGNRESADVNGGDEGQSGTELDNSDSPANSTDDGEATDTEADEVPPTDTTLDQSNNTTTNLNSTVLTNSSELGSDATVNGIGMDTTTELYDPGDDTIVSDGSSSQASSFAPSSSASSSAPPVDNQEIPPPGKQKPTESSKNNPKEDSGSGKVAANDEPKISKLEESSNGEGKEAASEEAAAKGANPDPIKEEAVDSDISKKEEIVMDVNAPEVKEESKVDMPLETSFEKQMGSGAADPPQSNFFSYFIVLAIITIIAYLVFHNKKKILGLIVEGRSGRQAGRRRSGGREYRKLDSNVEDMMETGRETSMRQVIY